VSFAFASIRSAGNRVLRAAIGAVLLGGTALIALHNWLGLGSSLGDFVNGLLREGAQARRRVAAAG
jgi:hypothetical protein